MAVVIGSVRAPVTGVARPLSESPDPVFARQMLGGGAMIVPDLVPGDAVAPVSGRVVKVHPHSVVVEDAGGMSVLVHLGVDTITLRGRGFTPLVAEGDQVDAGQSVISWNPADVAGAGLQPHVLVTVLGEPAESIAPREVGAHVQAGDPFLRRVRG